MDEERQQARGDALELALPGQLHQAAPPGRGRLAVGPGLGVEQRQPGHPLGCPAQDLEARRSRPSRGRPARTAQVPRRGRASPWRRCWCRRSGRRPWSRPRRPGPGAAARTGGGRRAGPAGGRAAGACASSADQPAELAELRACRRRRAIRTRPSRCRRCPPHRSRIRSRPSWRARAGASPRRRRRPRPRSRPPSGPARSAARRHGSPCRRARSARRPSATRWSRIAGSRAAEKAVLGRTTAPPGRGSRRSSVWPSPCGYCSLTTTGTPSRPRPRAGCGSGR